MHDWQELVRLRLTGLAINAADKKDIQAELAAHLGELYEAFRGEGLSEQEAVQRTLRQVGNWRDLQHEITIVKSGGHPMKKRLQQIWIPGLLSFALFTASLILLQQLLPFKPHLVFGNVGYLPWLLPLPCLGALAAYLSSRAGGSRSAVLFASLFPVFGLGFAFLFMFPAGLFLEGVGWHVDFRRVAADLLASPMVSLLVPAIALLLGAMPVQFFLSRRRTAPFGVQGCGF